MSITFDSDLPTKEIEKVEPCLCAQMSEFFGDFFEGKDSPAIRADLKANANPNCPQCHGHGVESVSYTANPTMNLANRNAAVLFQVLGIKEEAGEMTIPEARRAIMRATARSSLKDFIIPEEKIHGKPYEISPGVFEMKPVKMHDLGLSEEKISDYLRRFTEFVLAVSKVGATKIMWY